MPTSMRRPTNPFTGKESPYTPTILDFMPTPMSIAGPALAGLQKVRPTMQTLGEMLPEYTPVGGEQLYNAARRQLSPMAIKAGEILKRLPDMGWGAFQKFAKK